MATQRFYDGQPGPDIRRELNNFEAKVDGTVAAAQAASTAATDSKNAAATSATAAKTSETNAASSASAAAASANAAAASESAALASKNAAATSATAAKTSETNAASSASAAAASANAAAASAGGQLWVSGTTYAVGALVFSAATGRNYRRIVAGAGTTDPSLDSTNWRATLLDVNTGMPTIRPTLLLDFANSRSVDPRIAFTRASTATRTNEKGLIESVKANVPRLDFDPLTLACRGLLIEEARTNLLNYTDNIAISWENGLNTVFAVEDISPVDGSSYYYSIRSTGVAGFLFTKKDFTAPTTGTYALSAWVKVDNAALAASSNRLISVYVNGDSTKFLSFAAAGLVAGVWKRVSYSFTANSGDNIAFLFGYNFSTDTSVKLYFCHPQIEFGSFPTSYIPSSVTFTGRSSTGTYVGSDGLLKTAESGVARYSHNPNNLSVAPALLLEAAATNLLTYSEQFDNAAWGKSSASVSANVVPAPDGNMGADKLVDSTSTDSHYVYATAVSTTNTNTYTKSIYVMAAERSLVNLFVVEGSTYARHVQCTFNLATGVAGTVSLGGGATGSASIQYIGRGWYRCSVTATLGGTDTSIQSRIRLTDASGNVAFTGDGTSGLYIWGAQLEVGTFPTSYIPTTTAQVTRAKDTSTSTASTRAADVASMTGANFSSWYRQGEGTLFIQRTDAALIATGVSEFLITDEITTSVRFRQGAVITGADMLVGFGGAGVVDTLSFGVTPGESYRAALAFKKDDFVLAANGSVVDTDTSGDLGGMTQMLFPTLGSSTYQCVTYYPKRLSNAELQAITA